MVATRCVLSLASCRVIDVPCSGTWHARRRARAPESRRAAAPASKSVLVLSWYPSEHQKWLTGSGVGWGRFRGPRGHGAPERVATAPDHCVREPAASHGVREAAHHRDVPRAARESASAISPHTAGSFRSGQRGWVGGRERGVPVAQLPLQLRHQREHRVLLHQPVRREPRRMAAAV